MPENLDPLVGVKEQAFGSFPRLTVSHLKEMEGR